MKRAAKHLSDIFIVPIENDFGREFCAAFENYFRQHYMDSENILYMKYFLAIVREHMTSRFVFGHLYWCQRISNLKNQCKFCRLVKRCYILDKSEYDQRYYYVLYHYQRYDEHSERIFEENDFFSKDLNQTFKKCQPFEFVYSYNQLVNLFGVIAARLFFNIGKNYFFVGRFKQEHLYKYFLSWSKRLFASVCKNVSKQYISNAIHYLTPIRDYDPTYLKISNVSYIDYIGCKYTIKKKCT